MVKLPKRTAEQLRSHLSSLSPDELVDLLVDHAARDDELRDRLLVDAAKRGADTVDLKAFQRSLNAAIFNLTEGRYGGEYTSGDWVYGVNRAIDRLDELLAAGQAVAVVSLAELPSMPSWRSWSGPTTPTAMYRISLPASNGCTTTPASPPRHLPSSWPTGCSPGRSMGTGTCSWTRYPLCRRPWTGGRRPFPRPGPGALGPGSIRRAHERDADRWGSNYRITRVMERLAELAGDVDALVAVKSRDLSLPYDWLEVAEVYLQAGRHAEALDWAERGVAAFPDRPDPRLDEFLCEAYERAGRSGEAVDLAWRRFESRPELATYQSLATHAGRANAWAEWRPRAIAALRARIDSRPDPSPAESGRRWGRPMEPPGAKDLVDVLLWEGDPEAAWQEAVRSGVPHGLWMRLAVLREDGHPGAQMMSRNASGGRAAH